MPEATLQRLLHQAAEAQATLIIRGLVNDSLRDTFSRMQALIGNQRVAAQIDPQAFERYAVTRVPSFVMAREARSPAPCQSANCAPPTDFALVSGDVSLDYALTHISQHAPRFSGEARIFRQRLKK
jgi:conjugal transfer pilus assembly protein TrbC